LLPLLLGFSVPAIAHNEANDAEPPCLEECDSWNENQQENQEANYAACMLSKYNPPEETCEEWK
tara:strand:- start:208 stop:399 length:192 start_codon:yes stop_codon:yes gene_type:complete